MTTLIIPAVSLGNVPQLAVDLLIHTLRLTPSQALDDTYLHPFASPRDHLPDQTEPLGISTGLELYEDNKKQLAVVQQRSPVVTPYTKKFATDVLVPLAGKYDRVILVDLTNGGFDDVSRLHTIDVVTSDVVLNAKVEKLSLQDGIHEDDNDHFLGTTRAVIEARGKNVTSDVVLAYVYEGDNTNDAFALADKLASILELGTQRWQCPVSWTGMYGLRQHSNAMEDGLYG